MPGMWAEESQHGALLAPQQQAFRELVNADICLYAESQGQYADDSKPVIDKFGGMVWDLRNQYSTSWYLEGAVFYENGESFVIVSTAESNRASRMEAGFAYNYLDVWSQAGRVVSASNPRFVFGTRAGTALDFFSPRMGSVSWSGFQSMEEVLQHLGIEYSRFICGYSLQHRGLEPYYCALDWYFQDSDLRASGRDLWCHGLILDQWDPTFWYQGTVIRNDLPLYRGWAEHALGQTARYDPSEC